MIPLPTRQRRQGRGNPGCDIDSLIAQADGATSPIEVVIESDEHAVAADQDEAVLLRQLVSALPPPLRDVFVLSRFAGMTNQDVAAACGLSVKTVEWRMTRALALITL